tara:strand:+ start:701 stop:1849 length:1149 start_codon:yes stop_codon:yes gene_type:complete
MRNKIALIDSVAARGGSHHFYLFGQAKGLMANGMKVSLFTNDITNNPNIDGLNVHHYYKGIFGRKSNLIAGFLYLIGSMRSIFHAKFIGSHICHFHLFHVNFLVVFDLLLTRFLGMKVVYTIHDVVSNLKKTQSNKRLVSLVLKCASKILTHNEYSKNQLYHLFGKIKNNISIVPHGNYIPFINLSEGQIYSRKKLGLPKDKKILLFFGMIKRVKGLEIVLEALALVKEEHKDIVLVIAGKAWEDEFSVYQDIIDKHNLNDICIIRNQYIPSEEVNHYFASTDLVVLPYKQISQSGVLMMALSYQRPVLCSDLPPFKELINDGVTGFLFESESIASLVDKMSFIFNNNALLHKVTDQGFKLIKNKYNWNTIGALLKRSYHSL